MVRDHGSLAKAGEPGERQLPVKRFLIRYGDHFKLVEPANRVHPLAEEYLPAHPRGP
ncbi:MAG: hypothetical protein H6592_05540 [Flavobacteriales bacterium]|nr:hypothetical protein [Flavobacteriales bacterium]